MMSLLSTTVVNAAAANARGTLSDADTAAIINTIPDSIAAAAVISQALRDDLATLKSDTERTPPLIQGALFNPDGLPYRATFQGVIKDCEAGGEEVFAVPNYQN